MNVLRPALLSLALLAAPHLAQGANDLPSLGDASSSIVSPEQEFQMGRAWLSMLRGQVPAINDPQLKQFVEQTVYKLAETSDLQDHRLVFILIKDPEINAFAAPGGVIGVNGGLFLKSETEAEYAAVMAHELGHLIQRHFARGVENQQRMQLPLMAALLAGIVAAAAGGGDAGIAAIASTQAAAIQSQLRFSRLNEQEADRVGIVNLERAGYDPRAMPEMFGRLARQYRYDRTPPEFLLTHPVTDSRIADTQARAERFPKGGVEDSKRFQLMKVRAQMYFEETAGLLVKRYRAQLQENPDNDAVRYGLAMGLTKQGQLNEARDTLAPLLRKAPDDISYNLAQVDLDITANRLPDAQKRVQRLLELYPDDLAVSLAQVDLLGRTKQAKAASQLLDKLLKQRPIDPDLWNQAADVRGQAGDLVGVHQARAEYFALTGDYNQAIQQLGFAKQRAASNYQLAARIDARQQEMIAQRKLSEEILR